MAAHESARTTKFYDRTDDQIRLDEVRSSPRLKVLTMHAPASLPSWLQTLSWGILPIAPKRTIPNKCEAKPEFLHLALFPFKNGGKPLKIRYKSMEQNLRCRTRVHFWVLQLDRYDVFFRCFQLSPCELNLFGAIGRNPPHEAPPQRRCGCNRNRLYVLGPHDAQSHGQISAQQSPYMASAFGDLNQPLELVFRLGGGYPQFQVNRLDMPGLGATARKRSCSQIKFSRARCDSQRHQ